MLTPTTSTGGHLGVLLAITTGPFAGKTISAIYLPSVGDGICVQMTLAMSAPGHAVPTSFKVAMTTTGMGVLYLAKCDSRGQAACDFSSVLEPGFHLSDRAVGALSRCKVPLLVLATPCASTLLHAES